MTILKASLVILCLLCFRTTGSPQFNGGTFFMETEIWIDIPGYEGHYIVSNSGIVVALERKIEHRKYGWKTQKRRVLKKRKNGWGYNYVSLTLKTKTKTVRVCRLVMLAFKGDSLLDVDHLNGVKTDDRLSNLEYVTHRENMRRYHSQNETSSKFIGVSYHKRAKKWEAYINFKKKKTYLGLFETEQLASDAYKTALNKAIQPC